MQIVAVDFPDALLYAFAELRSGLIHCQQDMAIDMKPALEAMHAQAPVDTRDLEGKLTRYFDEESFAENKSIKGIGDLPAILQPLHEKSIHFGVATTDTCEAAVKCLKGMQILPLFSFFAGDQMAGDMPLKPDGRIISRAAAQWHIAPENILVVGDTINDMNFAHNGGAIAVGVLSGVSSREQLAPAADYILDSVADVPALIRQLEQKGL